MSAATTSTEQPTGVPTLVEFDAALDSLVIVWARGETPTIGPLDDPVNNAVAAWFEAVLDANPALAELLRQRFAGLTEVVPGLLVLPVASLRSALLTTLRHGVNVGMGAA